MNKVNNYVFLHTLTVQMNHCHYLRLYKVTRVVIIHSTPGQRWVGETFRI